MAGKVVIQKAISREGTASPLLAGEGADPPICHRAAHVVSHLSGPSSFQG